MALENNKQKNKELLFRPRLNALIHKGMQQPVVVLLAGPGYGKTQAVYDYLSGTGVKNLWIRLCNLDNMVSYFWNHVIRLLQPEFPRIASDMQQLGFPDSISKFDVFAQLLSNAVIENKRMILAFDNFGEIYDEGIKRFFDMMMKLEFPNFNLVLISNLISEIDSVAFISSNQTLILENDLRFTREEIADLYRINGISLQEDELDKIETYTEGWALSLHLLVQKHVKLGSLPIKDMRLSESVISDIFEERFFSSYTWKQQKVLLQMSLLDSFTKGFAVNLYKGDADELSVFKNNVFLKNEPSTGRYFFHYLYRVFLHTKLYLLDEEDRRQAWREAAEYYESTGDTLEATTCYGRCGDFDNMLDTIACYIQKQHGLTEKTAEFLLEHLDLLSAEDVRKNPLADYLRAHIYMSTLELGKAEELLIGLEEKISRSLPEDAALLGDVYVALGFLHSMRNQEDYGDYFKKAAAYLPGSSKFQSKDTLVIHNNHSFAMADNLPGAKERMELAAYNAAPWITKVLQGRLSGMEHLISAESAYLSYDFDRAQQQAYSAIYKAEPDAQHDFVCNSYYLLARIAWMQSNLVEMTVQIQNIVSYADKYKIGVLEEIRDTAVTWHYLHLRDYNRIPQSIVAMDRARGPILAYGRAQIVYASYLLSQKDYAKLVGMLENPRGLFLTSGIFHDRICLFIMLANGYYHLGQADAAIKALWTAYDMSYHNGLITFFVEGEQDMAALIDLARRQNTHHFAPEWLDSIQKEAVAFSSRADAVRAEYKKQNTATVPADNPLTKREQEILQALTRGLTREEIAVEQFVSVNTVKSTIRNIYNKLDANNRADAVFIAITRGYIEGHKPT